MKDVQFFLIPIIALLSAQLIKFVLESISQKTLKWSRLFNGNGGMPSAHTSFTFALTGTMLWNFGYTSPYFAISLIFSMVVAYDAMGLRKESGKQAEAINDILDEMFGKNLKKGFSHLKEELGHNPSEVFAGACYGMIISYIITSLM